jgi:putative transposase
LRAAAPPSASTGRWISFDRLANRRSFRTLHVVDDFTQECVAIEVDSIAARCASGPLARAAALRHSLRQTIVTDYGTEFVSRAMDAWAYAHAVKLDFIRPGKPVDNAFIESFNSRLRDECLNGHVFDSINDAQRILDAWRDDYNRVRPTARWPTRDPKKRSQGGGLKTRTEAEITQPALRLKGQCWLHMPKGTVLCRRCHKDTNLCGCF